MVESLNPFQLRQIMETPARTPTLKEKIYQVIFEADTFWGKTFDVFLLIFILVSVLLVMLETVPGLNIRYAAFFEAAEWIFLTLFSIEYLLRIYSSPKPQAYIFSFYGIVDLLAILPTYIGLILAGSQYLITIRAIRLLRVFRILKLGNYQNQSQVLATALKASRHKITVFLIAVVIIICIVGTLMYIIEKEQNSGFSSIPISMYWAVVTVTTVGYGDIAPATELGKFLSAILMILGYGILAVPTGIVSVELAQASQKMGGTIHAPDCPISTADAHDEDARYCKYCGVKL